MSAKFPGVVHGDHMLPHSLFKKMKSTFSQDLGNSQVKVKVLVDIVILGSGHCLYQGVECPVCCRNNSCWGRVPTGRGLLCLINVYLSTRQSVGTHLEQTIKWVFHVHRRFPIGIIFHGWWCQKISTLKTRYLFMYGRHFSYVMY